MQFSPCYALCRAALAAYVTPRRTRVYVTSPEAHCASPAEIDLRINTTQKKARVSGPLIGVAPAYGPGR